MGGMFGGGGSEPSYTPAPVATPAPVDTSAVDQATAQAAEAAKQKEITTARNARGRASTLLTGAAGLTDTAPTTKKRLLGE